MKQFRQVWHYMLAEPFLWLFYYFVQPSNFHASVESDQASKRAVTMFRLALPIFLISYFFLLLISYLFGSHINILAVLLGFVGGIALGTTRSIKWGIAGCFGLGIGLGLGFEVLPQALAHPSSLLISSIGIGLGIGLAIGLGTYGDFLGDSAKRFLGGVKGGIIGGVWEILRGCLWWALLGALGGVGGLLMGIVVGIVVNGTDETIIRGITIGAMVGFVLGLVRRGIRGIQRRRSGSLSVHLARTMLYSLVFGIVGGIVGGITWYAMGGKEGIISLWTMWSKVRNFSSRGTTEIILNVTLSTLIGIEVGVLLGIADTILAGLVVPNIRKAISASLNIGLRRGLETGVFLGIVVGILVSLASALTNGIAENALVGLRAGFVLALFYTIVDYRLPVYLVSSFSQLRLYLRLQVYLVSSFSQLRLYLFFVNKIKKFQDSTMFFTSLDHSSLHWDESVSLPLPLLSENLLAAFALDTDQALREISFILKERPSQINAVRNCLMEACVRCLKDASITLRDIATVPDQLAGILPLGTRVFDPRWQDRFVLMNDAGLDARRYYDWGDWQIKQDALQSMLHHLGSVNLEKRKSGDSLTKEDKLNNRLLDVVLLWKRIVTSELESLEDESPRLLDNPYNPGPRLKRGDKLFVGRVDLAKQLMQGLGSGGSHPTFSLEGERRMGKSSLLEQLPILLSAQYLPVYITLQNPGLRSSAAAFLSAIAETICTAMQERGLQINALEEALLHQTNRDNEAATYYLFEKWLKGVENTLEQQNHVLLLALDEFETLDDEKTTKLLNLPLLLDWLRSVTQNYSHVALLFSGVHNVSDLITRTGMNWGSYFVHVQTLKVSFLQPQEAHKLIVQPVPDFPGEQVFSEEVVEAIIKETSCHPFLVQAVCQALIRRLNADNSPRYRAELRDIAPAVDQVFDRFDYFDDLWRRTDQHQRACLEALQELGEGNFHAITQKCGLDEKIVHHTLQILIKKRDMVLLQDGIYRMSVPIFRTWIGRQIPNLQN